MHTEITQTGANERRLDQVIQSADYQPEIDRELRKLQKNVDIKGFRKGKTPLSFIKRNYGPRIIFDTVYRLSQKSFYDTIEENKYEIIDSPVVLKSDIPPLTDGGDTKGDCTFSYLIGIYPHTELHGLDAETSYNYYEADPSDDEVGRAMEDLQRQFGSMIQPEDIAEKDHIEISIKELENGEVKEDGIEAQTRIAIDLIADEKLKEKIIASKKGDLFDCDIYQLEKDRPKEYVHKYILNLESSDDENSDSDQTYGPEFRAEILHIDRWVLAEINDDFFKKAFPEQEIASEEDAREHIRKHMIKECESLGEQMLVKEVIDTIMAKTPIDLPEDYLHQLYHDQQKQRNPSHTHEDGEDLSAWYDNYRRQIILNLLNKKLNTYVTDEEVDAALTQTVRLQFAKYGPLPEDVILDLTQRMISDPKQRDRMRVQVYHNKLRQAIRSTVQTEVVSKTIPDLQALFNETFPPRDEEE